MKQAATQYDHDSAAGVRWDGTACPTGKTISGLFFFIMLILASFALFSCKRVEQHDSSSSISAGDTSTSEEGANSQAGDSALRLVSLSPALTDMLIDLGLKDAVVGRDAWDEELDDSIPRVGDLSNLDLERVILLRPTHLVLQQGGRSIPESLKNTARAQHWTIINLHIDSLDDIFSALHQLAGDMADACRNDEQRVRILDNERILNKRFTAATAPLGADTISNTGTVLSFYALDPPGAFGPGSYLSDMLARMGITNALQSGGAWQNLDAESILRADAQTILVIRSGPVEDSGQVADLKMFAALDLRAVRERRAVIISHPQALLPGTSLIELAEIIRGALTGLNNYPKDAGTGVNTAQEGESN